MSLYIALNLWGNPAHPFGYVPGTRVTDRRVFIYTILYMCYVYTAFIYVYIPYLLSLPICPTSSTTVSILSTWTAAAAFCRPSAVFSVRPRLPSLLPTRFRTIRRRLPPACSDAPQKAIRNRSDRLEIAIKHGNRLLSSHASRRVCHHGI